MTEEEFRNGPAKQRPLEEFSDKPNEPSHINPFGLSDRELEEARRLNAGMANRATISEALHLPDDPNARMILEPMLQWFDRQDGAHLPYEQATAIHSLFLTMANGLVAGLPRNAERTVALRKLLEARDCAYRAAVSK